MKKVQNSNCVKFFCCIFILLSACTVVNPIRNSPYNTFKRSVVDKPFDVIIVPGVPYNKKKWKAVMRSRMQWSIFLIEKGYAQNVIYSGSAVHSPYIESRIMALYAAAMGLSNDKIFTEEKAEHSTENVYYAYQMAKQKGFKNIALATDPYQMNNLRRYIKKNKMEIKILPILIDTVWVMDRTEPKIDPSSAFVKDFKSLRERESFGKRMRGTMGKNIQKTEKRKK